MTEYTLLIVICVSDVVSSIFLVMEYFFGRPDVAMKNEAKQKRRLREKHTFSHLTIGEGK